MFMFMHKLTRVLFVLGFIMLSPVVVVAFGSLPVQINPWLFNACWVVGCACILSAPVHSIFWGDLVNKKEKEN